MAWNARHGELCETKSQLQETKLEMQCNFMYGVKEREREGIC